MKGEKGSLSEGWDALRSGDWGAARTAFEAAHVDRPNAEADDGLARALWWLADVDGAIDSWERAYAGYRKLGGHSRASRVAQTRGDLRVGQALAQERDSATSRCFRSTMASSVSTGCTPDS